MQIVIITGMSGAGKTVALKTMEDMGYYSVDNMPVALMPKFTEILKDTSREKIAVGIDIRSAEHLTGLEEILAQLTESGIDCKVIFLDSSNQVLLKRFKETRRAHPLSPSGHIEDGIREERESLRWLMDLSDYVLDTSEMKTRNLRSQLEMIFSNDRAYKNLYLNVISFGYKYGIPQDADIVMDVRFLPNPYYVDGLKEKTGLQKEVRDYVLNGREAEEFVERLTGLVDFLIPKYIEEGKNQLIIAFGCTGGKHRSVTIAETVYNHLKETAEYGLNVEHRDIKK